MPFAWVKSSIRIIPVSANECFFQSKSKSFVIAMAERLFKTGFALKDCICRWQERDGKRIDLPWQRLQ
jgi:hypothetical protein